MEIIDLSSDQVATVEGEADEGLRSLGGVRLSEDNQRMLDFWLASNCGEADWRGRKGAEARDVMALSQIAPPGRLRVGWMDMTSELRILLIMGVPVARRPDATNQLPQADEAVLGLTYPRQAIHRALPGTVFFELLEPEDAWHANIGRLPPPGPPHQILCLGTELPSGIRCTDLIVAAYGALSMQNIQIDERDTAGVLNLDAARWWQQNTHRIPLCATPFLSEEPPRQATN